jgi:uncharacterized protein YndB with AHSA1/START domain
VLRREVNVRAKLEMRDDVLSEEQSVAAMRPRRRLDRARCDARADAQVSHVHRWIPGDRDGFRDFADSRELSPVEHPGELCSNFVFHVLANGQRFQETIMTQALQGGTQTNEQVQTIRIERELVIDAPPEIVFDSIFDEIESLPGMDGKSMHMKIERWPGGRWFRDLPGNAGHLWAHVMVIKPPALVEFWGPLMMSYPTVSHVQYRVVAEGGKSRLKFLHRAMGLIEPAHAKGMQEGWGQMLDGMKSRAEKKK